MDEYTILRNTIYNAGANLLRGKNDKEIPLFGNESSNAQVSDKEAARNEREALFGEGAK